MDVVFARDATASSRVMGYRIVIILLCAFIISCSLEVFDGYWAFVRSIRRIVLYLQTPYNIGLYSIPLYPVILVPSVNDSIWALLSNGSLPTH